MNSQEAENLKTEFSSLKEKLTDAEDKLDEIAKESAELKEQVDKIEN